MFTGLVEEMGTVRELVRSSDGTRLSIASTVAREGLALGDSVCVDGACTFVRVFKDCAEEGGSTCAVTPDGATCRFLVGK